MDVFEFSDYRDYLREQIAANSATRGYQTLLAEAAGCKSSFLSQALHTHVNLTPDHGAGLCHFWKFGDDETDWFMELLSLARAGSEPLRRLCERRLEMMKGKRRDLAVRIKSTSSLPKEAQTQYYTSWYFAAIHILTTIAAYDTAGKISARLNLNEKLVREVLGQLEGMGLVASKGGVSWRATNRDIHLPKGSALNVVNNTNWRQIAINRIQCQENNMVRYTAVHSLSVKDIARVQETLISAIEKTREIVKPSREEELVCLTCDLFKI